MRIPPKRPTGTTTGASKASSTQKADKAGKADFSEAIGDREENTEDQAKKVIEIMEQAVTLEVPNKVDYESGNNWGEING